jgi:hypothetical protein
MRWGSQIIIIAGLTVGLATSLNAADDRGEPVVIDAKELSFDRPQNLAYGTGDVVVHYRDAVLRADKVKVNTLTKELWADGNMRLNRDGQEWAAPGAYYNFETREFRAEKIRGLFEPVSISGQSVTGVGTNHYAVAGATVSPCDYDPPHFRVQARRAEIWPNDRIVLYGVTLRAGNVPVFWVPVMVWPLHEEMPLVTISAGHDSRWGFFVLTSTSWQLNRSVDVTAHIDGRTQRGVGFGPDVNYRVGADGRGTVRSYYIHDENPMDETDVGKIIPRDRYRALWQHKQTLPGDVAVTVDLNKWSDPDVLDDFFPREFQEQSEPQTVVDVTKRGANYSLSLQARPQLNPFFAEVERLPEATWAVNRLRLLNTPVFYEGETRAGYLVNHAGDTGDPLFDGQTVRADTFHQLVVPQLIGGWLSVVPRAGIRGTYYLDTPDTAPRTSEVRRVAYDLGTEASFKLSRTWSDVRNEWLQIDGLRHIAQPFVNYSWMPDPHVNTTDIYQFDTVRTVALPDGEILPVTRYMPVDFPAYNAIDSLQRLHVVRFGLRQRLQTRRNGQSWDLADLEGWTDYRIEQNPGERDWGDFYGVLRLRPTSWSRLEAGTRYDMNSGILREFNTGVHVAHDDRWSVGVGTRFMKEDSNLVSTEVAVRLTRHWTAVMYDRVDIRDGTWEEQEYMLRQETHDWFINYGVRYRSPRVAKDEVMVFLAFTLKAFPSMKLMVN